MIWVQKRISIDAKHRGCHLITKDILGHLPEIKNIEIGLLHIFILHTSASLTINENADPDVRIDMEMALNTIVPENLPYVHVDEGKDDMPAHVKSSLMGNSLTLPISNSCLALGAWQGIYLNEHRNNGGKRTLLLTIQGQSKLSQSTPS